MIVDILDNAQRYYCIHPGFRTAFEFLRSQDLSNKEPGTYAIEKKDVFVMVSVCTPTGKNGLLTEAHKKYIDIQVTLSGTELIGYKPVKECSQRETPYDAHKDCEFYRDTPESWCAVPEGAFAIFFPEDAHAPLAGEGHVKKAVFKVRVNSPE